MVEQPGNRHALLLTSAQHVLPVLPSIPSAFAVGKIAESCILQDLGQFLVAPARVLHVDFGVRVDDLVTQRAGAKVRPLGKEHDAVDTNAAGPRSQTAVDWPQAGDDARNGRLADAVWASD